MRKFVVGLAAAAFLVGLMVAPVAWAGDEKTEKAPKAETTVTGYITDSHCKGEGAKEGHTECALKCAREKGATLGVWDASASKFFAVDDQKKAEEFAGQMVTVKGVIDEEAGTIKVASMTKSEKKSS